MTKCWHCGLRTTSGVEGPPGVVLCEGCILRAHVETGADFAGACAFCDQQMGVPRGWFFRRRPALRVGLRHGEQVMCDECLASKRKSVGERSQAD